MNTRAVTDKMQDWSKKATEKAKVVGQSTDQYVRENTWSSIAIAAVVGCLLGFLLANRKE
jgi:ElaB/YqjD/DUF883 family membrane-anchored ribosome-binding protein